MQSKARNVYKEMKTQSSLGDVLKAEIFCSVQMAFKQRGADKAERTLHK